jgi:membrane protease YdiL (CAAX protease family)
VLIQRGPFLPQCGTSARLVDLYAVGCLALIGLFLILTFALTWTAWIVPNALAPGNAVLGLGGPVFLLGVFAPALVAIALTWWTDGRLGISNLLTRLGKWQVSGQLYLFATGYMLAAKLLAAVIHRAVKGAWPGFSETPLILMFGAILVSTWVQAGEEVGWRGYLLPRLANRLGPGGASLVLGVIWACWHLPLFFIPGSGSDGQSFPNYVLYVTALSVAMAWLYWRSGGSLLLVMLMHASVNNTIGIVPAALPPDQRAANPMLSFDGSLVTWAMLGILWAVAALLLFKMRRASITAE